MNFAKNKMFAVVLFSFLGQSNLAAAGSAKKRHECVQSSSDRQKICGICYTQFNTHRLALVCERGHTAIKQYKCADCGSIHSSTSRLQNHRRTHTGEKPFKCPRCGFTSAQKSNAMYHCKRNKYKPLTRSSRLPAGAPQENDFAPLEAADIGDTLGTLFKELEAEEKAEAAQGFCSEEDYDVLHRQDIRDSE